MQAFALYVVGEGMEKKEEDLRRRGGGAGDAPEERLTAEPGAQAMTAPDRCDSDPAADERARYQRVLLKLSGEALMGEDAFGINRRSIERIVADIGEVVRLGMEVAIVIGGGNIFRGVALGATGMDRATADYMGMMAT